MEPRVSVVIPAFNLAAYLPAAIDSALAQRSPGGPIEVIVVDDGSTDETADVMARYGDVIRAIRQPNRGLVAAVDRGIAEARGEFIALLDADDEWPVDRLARHVAILEARPEVGLVHGDMTVTDRDGSVIHPSFFAYQRIEPTDGRVLGRLLAGNFISGGASTFRASLRAAFHPIDPAAAYPDWWLAACIAAVAEIVHDPACANLYRFHGSNMGLASGPERQLQIQRLELPWRRWMFSNLVEDDSVTISDVRTALGAWRFGIVAAAAADGNRAPVRELIEADPRGAAELLDALAQPRESGAPVARGLLRALAADPFDGAIGVDLDVALSREASLPVLLPSPPLNSLETRSELVLAWLDELVEQPALLRAFGRHASSGGDETLVVLARPDDNVRALVELVEADAACSDERCSIVVITAPSTTPARALLAARASAHLSVAAGRWSAVLNPHDAVNRALATTV